MTAMREWLADALAQTDLTTATRALVARHGEAAVRDALDQIAEEDRPNVCPGCQAVNALCRPGCIDADPGFDPRGAWLDGGVDSGPEGS